MRISRLTSASSLLVLLAAACASSGATPEATPDGASESGEESNVCVREATVEVRVKNESSYDLEVGFGSYRTARPADGFSLTTYYVPRYYLEDYVLLRVLRGGLQVGRSAVIPTEAVVCNIATLVVGSQPRYSIFYGDELLEPVPDSEKGDGDAAEGEELRLQEPPRQRGASDHP